MAWNAAASPKPLLWLFWISLLFVSASAQLCMEKERKALLDLRTGLSVADGRLSSWRGDDCCKWEGVECHNITNHVVKLNLSYLDGSTPNKSEVSSSLLDLEHLSYLDLSWNNFGGAPMPEFLGSLTQLKHLDLSHNSFSGPIPESLAGGGDGLGPLGYMLLSDNRLNGSIPSSICTANLQIMNLANNDLSGALPDCWSNSQELMIMDVSSNKLSGGIPETLGLLTMLRSLHLSNNSLTGTIPSTLQQCRELSVIDLSLNELSDGIPSWIGGSLKSLRVLSLRSNKLSGEIPWQLSLSPSLQVLDLAHNNLSDTLPPSFGNFSSMATRQNSKKLAQHISYISYNSLGNRTIADALPLNSPSLYYNDSVTVTAKGLQLSYTRTLFLVTSIDLSNNNLFGEIPEELTNLRDLHFLNLSWNHFSGNIPNEISLMGQLESLDLSKNNLSGEIPPSISALNFLCVLNLSYNNFIGKIPVGTQLQSFTNLSYIDNPELCGEPLQINCTSNNSTIDVVAEEEDMHEDDEYKGIWYFIGFALGFMFGFWGFMGTIMIKRSRRIRYILLIDTICSCFIHM